MTVAELIEELRDAPQDAPVTFERGGDLDSVLWSTEHDGEALRITGVVLA